ncbi:endolytic transglycosylase MltG [Balneolales bacterium ANBcel1]|nr:endolytic transglycosylase MltG [Balneolales bacterium ANBcel1]
MSITFFGHLSWKQWGIAVLVFSLSFLLVFLSRSYRLYSSEAINASVAAELFLYEPSTLEELMELLDEQHVVYDRKELQWASDIFGYRRFNPGRYVLEGPVSYQDFLTRFALGLQDPMPLRVPAGASKEALKIHIARQMRFEIGELEEAMRDTAFLNQHELEPHLIYGRMLPDTYEVFWTTGPRRLLARLLSEFDSRVTQPHAGRMEELGRTVDEITTLASIIEWEARYDHEKPAISGLYWNRLNRRWRLQADPTVNYAKGERARLVFADYRIDHPYNTYRIHGLPPGPITNPSYAAISAALYPEDHNYMYMVATPEGTHAFSRTYAEHRQKSREWTDWLREERRKRAEMEREEALRRAEEQN